MPEDFGPTYDNPFQAAVEAAAKRPGATVWADGAGWYYAATEEEAQRFEFEATEIEDWREYL